MQNSVAPASGQDPLEARMAQLEKTMESQIEQKVNKLVDEKVKVIKE